MALFTHPVNRNILFLTAFFIGVSSLVFAQPAGFQGKRFIIGLEFPTGPTLTRRDYSYLESLNKDGYGPFNDTKYSSFGFVIRPSLYLEYILTRKSSLQVIGRFSTRKVDIESYSDYSPTNPTTLVSFYPTERSKATFISGGLRYKFYSKDAIAPIGTYQTVAVEYNLMKYNFSDQNFATYDANSPNYAEYRNPQQTNTSKISIGYGAGVERAIGNSVLMNIGVEAGLIFNLGNNSSVSSKSYADILGPTQILKNTLFNVVFGFALAP